MTDQPRYDANTSTAGIVQAAAGIPERSLTLSATMLQLTAVDLMRPGGNPQYGLDALAIAAGSILSHIPDQSERDAALLRFEQMTARFAEKASQ
jgi:hypothetical protein